MIRLQYLRKKANYTQKKVATDLGMKQSTYSRYEREECAADYATLCRFAEYFNVSLDYLLGREDSLFVSARLKTESDIEKIYNALSDPNKAQLIGFGKGLLMNERKDLEKILGKRGS